MTTQNPCLQPRCPRYLLQHLNPRNTHLLHQPCPKEGRLRKAPETLHGMPLDSSENIRRNHKLPYRTSHHHSPRYPLQDHKMEDLEDLGLALFAFSSCSRGLYELWANLWVFPVT